MNCPQNGDMLFKLLTPSTDYKFAVLAIHKSCGTLKKFPWLSGSCRGPESGLNASDNLRVLQKSKNDKKPTQIQQYEEQEWLPQEAAKMRLETLQFSSPNRTQSLIAAASTIRSVQNKPNQRRWLLQSRKNNMKLHRIDLSQSSITAENGLSFYDQASQLPRSSVKCQ